MIVTINRIHEGKTRLCEDTDIQPQRCSGYRLQGPLRCVATFEKRGPRIHASVECDAEVQLSCIRCLDSFSHQVHTRTEIFLHDRSTRVTAEVEAVLDPAYPDFYFDDTKREIDLSPAILDDIEVALPMKPLCSPECTGIAPRSAGIVVEHGDGIRRKTEDTVDPRWEKLKQLRR
jgi:uncharacterized protein